MVNKINSIGFDLAFITNHFNCSNLIIIYIIIIAIKNIFNLLNLKFGIVISLWINVAQVINCKHFKLINYYYFIIVFIIINFQNEQHLIKFGFTLE